jgi:multiple sugar transport system substrate-binding protein
MRRFVSFTMLIALVVTLLVTPALSAEKKIMVWSGLSETQKPLEKAAEIFMAQNPGVKVEVLTFDLRDFEAKVAASIPTGSAADVIVMDHSLVRRYAKANLLAPAPKEIVEWVNTPGRYIDLAPQFASYQDKVVAVPFYGGGPALFYNKDHFQEAGLTKPPETVEEVYQYAVKLRKMNDKGELTRAGISLRLTGPTGGLQKWAFVTYQMAGVQPVENGKEPDTFHAAMDNEASARALMWHVNLLHGKDKSDDWALKHDAEGFAAGVASMFMRESWVIPYVKEKGPNINFGVQVMPRDKFWGIYDWLVSGSVPVSCPQKDLAWKFTLAMQEKEVLDILFRDSGWIPSRRDLNFDDILAWEPRFRPFVELPKGAHIYFEANCFSYSELWQQAGEVIQAAFRDANLVNNLEGCKAVVKKAHDLANKILQESDEYGE